MAVQNPLKILLLDQVVVTIEGWSTRSRKDYLGYDNSTYRNLFPNQYITIKPLNTVSGAGITDTVTLQDAASVDGVTVVTDAPGETTGERAIVDDSGTATPPHFWQKARTRVEFWSGVIGIAQTMTVTTTSGSATLTVGSNLSVIPGQAISGTGIPSGATVVSVPVDALTSIIISHQATASAAVAATLTGSDYVGGYWEDEALGDGKAVAILQ